MQVSCLKYAYLPQEHVITYEGGGGGPQLIVPEPLF